MRCCCKLAVKVSVVAAAVMLADFASVAQAAGTKYEANWESLDKRPCPEWFLDAKFGIFIHWGLYSVPGWGRKGEYAEWYWDKISSTKPKNRWLEYHKRVWGDNFDYANFAPLFRCENFDPDLWADIFVRSGAKYIVPTSKHHEGFALWPSAEASKTWGRPWNAVETGPKRDLLGELGEACRKNGLKYGFYYSLYEWYNPLWKSDRQKFVTDHMFPQFKDVVTRYKPAIIFSDGEWDMQSKEWKSEELLAWLFNESPCKDEVVINDRWGKDCRHKHGGYWTTEYAAGLKDSSHPWEESRGMGFSYGWNRIETVDDYKSARELIMVLIDLVSRGGNLLLDIGPTGDGRIPVIMQERLVEIGDWLKVNGEAIYGTRYAGKACQWTDGTMPEQKFGEYKVKYSIMDQVGQKPKDGLAVKQAFFTKKPDALYAITPGWPGEELVIKDIKVSGTPVVTMLGYEGSLKCAVKDNTLTVEVPKLNPGQVPCRHAYVFKIPGSELIVK
jgi:alpha-L-fucosidase